jgi:predicted thioesterase
MSASTKNAQFSRVVTAVGPAEQWGKAVPPAALTPFALGLAAVACHEVVAPLAESQITVGTEAHTKHYAPSPVGAVLTARAELVNRVGSRLDFVVEVREAERRVAQIDLHALWSRKT